MIGRKIWKRKRRGSGQLVKSLAPKGFGKIGYGHRSHRTKKNRQYRGIGKGTKVMRPGRKHQFNQKKERAKLKSLEDY